MSTLVYSMPAQPTTSASAAPSASQLLRCSRCQQSLTYVAEGPAQRSLSPDGYGVSGIRIGHNIYYCDRCAALVGYQR